MRLLVCFAFGILAEMTGTMHAGHAWDFGLNYAFTRQPVYPYAQPFYAEHRLLIRRRE